RAERDKDGNLKNNRISFFAKVYDGTLLNLENTDLYYIIHQKEIEEQKRKILKGLEKLNIDHGDFLSQNICIS
ncbi:MAG: hypothetical protein QM532_03105, partial [Cyanobium sp. MAG06]|nr:hypothetical protein [Cyanobium sp. MAG06]